MDLEHLAIERLKTASEMSLRHYGLPLVITDSGGKDSMDTALLALNNGEPLTDAVWGEVMFDTNISGEIPEHREFCPLRVPAREG